MPPALNEHASTPPTNMILVMGRRFGVSILMSTNKMLIDAAHPEETRVAVLVGNRLHDFDVESVARKQIKSNIYLAKVIRVEPSLQAAFVDYGGNRHGFLSFSEIHPDYYQIPIEDRQAVLAEHQAAELAEEVTEEAALTETSEEISKSIEVNGLISLEQLDEEPEELNDDYEEAEEDSLKRRGLGQQRYKIQEVIKRRQILLIQVIKEERGNKGAALTTYISLAGRYCVLMPNTARGGGISRKITNSSDRKKLRAILSELEIPKGIAVIVRTAGSKRSKTEIKRDYEYLLRLWDSIRKLTLESSAPSLVHEEGNLIKRAIRDLYARDIQEIIVAGEHGYRMAKDFIKLLVPSHAKRVQPYTETKESIFQHYQVENQLDALHAPEVKMTSGAYIVINPTEALVSIDVNSGRSTRERNIEETAFKTNLEAADEIARQLRLRDQAGLIVIDFIDMESNRNNTLVEKRLKEATRQDRARIQIGTISPFGLLEMSRQRIRMSLIETSSDPCPHCEGTGIRRSTDSSALVALRTIQEEANIKDTTSLTVHVPTAVALYILNQKREMLADIERKTEVSIILNADETLIPPGLRLERINSDGKIELVARNPNNDTTPSEDKPSKRKRRHRRRVSSDEVTEENDNRSKEKTNQKKETSEETSDVDVSNDDKSPKRRRRGKRGGRRRRVRSEVGNADEESFAKTNAEDKISVSTETDPQKHSTGRTAKEKVNKTSTKPVRKRTSRKRTRKPAEEKSTENIGATAQTSEKKDEASTVSKPLEEPSNSYSVSANEATKTKVINIGEESEETKRSPKKGWWRSGK